MKFIQQNYIPGQTIAAIATPPGEGGVAMIRISGFEAFKVADQIFSRDLEKLESHRVYYGKILDEAKTKIDDVMLLPMRGPKTYTGEDTVEIFCHGGSLITRRVLARALQVGARAANPGEFTFKAFINGKIDLAQAEAVQELIGAKNERALDSAAEQLEGTLSKKVRELQSQLTTIAAILEAWVDFPEEGLEFATLEEIVADLEKIKLKIALFIDSFHEGKILHEGLSLCLVGAPNVGKSSLMNALLEKDRAIVSTIPGTTRDLLEDHLKLCGLNFRILDTAGIRETDELIELEGIKRTKAAMSKADLILLVMDSQESSFKSLLNELPQEKTVLIWNKCDLPHSMLPTWHFEYHVKISAKTKEGLQELKDEINKIIWKHGPPSKEEVIITNVRHHEALKEAHSALESLIHGLKTEISPEFLSFEMRSALKALGKIMGTDVSEDILDSIFSTFCIGK